VAIARAVIGWADPGASIVAADFVRVETSGRWSSSWREPMPQRETGARPPMNRAGLSFWRAAAMADIALVTPGPR